MTLQIENHPCFNDASRHTYGRIHLPVAPKCNIQCNYCNRQFDCMNENRPGVTSKVLSPAQAITYLDTALRRSPNISVVGIAGPGDPFANPDETMETLRMVRARYPDMLLCVATNGLELIPYIDELAELQVSHVTITINAIDPEIGAKVYAWARQNRRVYRYEEAANLLIENQLESLQRLKAAGVMAKVNSIIIPGINDTHMVAIAEKVAALGADILNCLPYYNTADTFFENIPEPPPEMVSAIQAATSHYLPQMKHCARCRADAAGIIGEINSEAMMRLLTESAAGTKRPERERPYVAVGSIDGVTINQHLGEAARFLVYGLNRESGACILVDARKAPPAGGGQQRWETLSETLSDCRVLLVNGAGNSPIRVMNASGIEVVVMDGQLDHAVQACFDEQEIKGLVENNPVHACGSNCSGNKGGCH